VRKPEPFPTNAPRERPPLQAPLLIGFGIILALTLLGPYMTISDDQVIGEGNTFRESVYFASLLLIFFGVRPIHHPRRLLAVPLPIIAALAWCWLSITWAIDPGIAFRRLILTTLVIWTVFVGVRQLGYERTLLMVRIALVLILLANFFASIELPDVGIHQARDSLDPGLIGDWRGFMMQKNFAGLACAITVIVFLFDAKRIPVSLRIAVLAATFFFVLKSESRTSWGACAVGLAIGFMFARYHARYRAVLLPISLAILVAAAAALTAYDPVSDRLVTNQALTGRPEIWDMLFRYSGDHTTLGSGFGSFWGIGDYSPVYHYGTGWITALGSGHSGFLDLLVSIGLPGAILVAVAAFLWPIWRLLVNTNASGPRGALIMALIVFFLAYNVTETAVFDRDSIGQVFLMIAMGLLYTIAPPAPRSSDISRKPSARRKKTRLRVSMG
jgi:exopolysaccharide production protein ExoQ